MIVRRTHRYCTFVYRLNRRSATFHRYSSALSLSIIVYRAINCAVVHVRSVSNRVVGRIRRPFARVYTPSFFHNESCCKTICLALLCPVFELAHPALSVNVSSFEYQGIADFSCQPGYVLIGAASMYCQMSAQWSEPTPSCSRMSGLFCLLKQNSDEYFKQSHARRQNLPPRVNYSMSNRRRTLATAMW